mmetsp:Transcript_27001/g.71016  ORF Transcript_27001/g.71016 Transcript_27001/m.71016 type:complete len:261 (-) Transcript_27001:439-1221(-)
MTTQPRSIDVYLVQERGRTRVSTISANVTSHQEFDRFLLALRNLNECRPASLPQIKFHSRDGLYVRVSNCSGCLSGCWSRCRRLCCRRWPKLWPIQSRDPCEKDSPVQSSSDILNSHRKVFFVLELQRRGNTFLFFGQDAARWIRDVSPHVACERDDSICIGNRNVLASGVSRGIGSRNCLHGFPRIPRVQVHERQHQPRERLRRPHAVLHDTPIEPKTDSRHRCHFQHQYCAVMVMIQPHICCPIDGSLLTVIVDRVDE